MANHKATTMGGTPRTRETTQTSLWPDVRAWIERKASSAPGRARPIAICSICLENELDIMGLPRSAERVASIEPALVTICGHMACYDCLETCILTYPVPTNGDIHRYPDFTSYLRDVPLTLPEGGWQPDSCNGCRRRRATTFAMQTGDLLRIGAARHYVDEANRILGPTFTLRLMSALHMGTLGALERTLAAEYPSWGQLWDETETLLPIELE
ncbi:hypothetical protein B0I37DRAFT_412901 [Chaetomium sp. MPI-CAGE-AT-0009]|nr:hypothetical protein B0I37DRAFT_412901 [Chaetomium sp. MPI-CAGE-AT-0009]